MREQPTVVHSEPPQPTLQQELEAAGITEREVALAIGSRIREAREVGGRSFTQAALAELIGMHVNTIGKIERGDSMPTALQLLAIGLAVKTSAAWLLAGAPYTKQAPAPGAATPPADTADLVLVRAYSVTASAGNGSEVQDENVIGRFAFKRSWLERKGLRPENLAVVTARGDSMEPTVRDGDILLVDRHTTRISADGIYLIERDNQLYCKRLQALLDGGVNVMSDNSRYDVQHLRPEAAAGMRVTGRVVWIGGER